MNMYLIFADSHHEKHLWLEFYKFKTICVFLWVLTWRSTVYANFKNKWLNEKEINKLLWEIERTLHQTNLLILLFDINYQVDSSVMAIRLMSHSNNPNLVIQGVVTCFLIYMHYQYYRLAFWQYYLNLYFQKSFESTVSNCKIPVFEHF